MEKIPTAEEFYQKWLEETDNRIRLGQVSKSSLIPKYLIEFALLHLEAAKQAIIKNAKVIMTSNCHDHTPYWGACGSCGRYDNHEIPSSEINKDSILTAYPSENIK